MQEDAAAFLAELYMGVFVSQNARCQVELPEGSKPNRMTESLSNIRVPCLLPNRPEGPLASEHGLPCYISR